MHSNYQKSLFELKKSSFKLEKNVSNLERICKLK